MSTWRPLGVARRDRDPRALSESLDHVTRQFGGPPAQILTAVFAHWAELVGEDIAAHATPKSLRSGVLVVTVDHPAWATQLRYLSSHVIDELQRRTAAGDEIRELRIQVGGAEPPDDGAAPSRRRSWRQPGRPPDDGPPPPPRRRSSR